MVIHLDENWFLDCDEKSVNLTEKKLITGENTRGLKPKAESIGQVRDIVHGFYGTVAQACEGYLHKDTASMPGVMAATSLIAAWNDCTARVEAACAGIKKPKDVEARPALPQAAV